MKISNITMPMVRDYCGVANHDSDVLFSAIMDAAAQYIITYTGLTAEQIDEYADLTIAYYCICYDMYTNRGTNTDLQTYENKAVSQILSSHAINYVGR